MRHWIKTHRRSAMLVGITLAVPAYLFLLVLGQTLSVRAGYQDQIDTIEPRIARMQGLVEKEEALREALSGVNNVMNDHIYPRNHGCRSGICVATSRSETHTWAIGHGGHQQSGIAGAQERYL